MSSKKDLQPLLKRNKASSTADEVSVEEGEPVQAVGGTKEEENAGNPDLRSDMASFLLLVVLYLLQGVPLGLTFGSLPFLLNSKLSYSDLALFSLSSYPYSLKLLWSPFVDTVFWKSFGRRKSWIIPMQTLIGLALLYLGSHIDSILQLPGSTQPLDEIATAPMMEIPVMYLTVYFLVLVFLCATQDIAVDGWALTLLRKENLEYASTAQTVGLNSGYFLSFTVFLAFNSPEFCNKYIYAEPQETGLFSLGGYLRFWGFAYLMVTLALLFLKREVSEATPDELAAEKQYNGNVPLSVKVKGVYKTIFAIMSAPNMRTFIVVLLVAKVGFIANEAVSGLKLIEYGLHKEDLALTVLLDFPFQILGGYWAAKWSSGSSPLQPWRLAFLGRLLCAVLAMLIVAMYPSTSPDGSVPLYYFLLVVAITVTSSFMSTIQFVGMGCFFAKISDPLIGGSYMTLLNTLSNFGGTWPRYPILKLVDALTVSECVVPNSTLLANITLSPPETCSTSHDKDLCKDTFRGTCHILRDGYYSATAISVILGLALLLFFINQTVRRLERLPLSAWRLKHD